MDISTLRLNDSLRVRRSEGIASDLDVVVHVGHWIHEYSSLWEGENDGVIFASPNGLLLAIYHLVSILGENDTRLFVREDRVQVGDRGPGDVTNGPSRE